MEKPADAPTLRTRRLILRPYRMRDADAWFAIQSDPGVLRYLDWPARSRSESRQHLKDRTRHTRLRQADDFLALAVEYDGHLIGDMSLHLRTVQAQTRSAEIGWVLATGHTGKGYATEAGIAMLDFAFETLDARQVTAVINADNHRSLNLATRLGFTETRRDGADIVLTIPPGQHSEHGHIPGTH